MESTVAPLPSCPLEFDPQHLTCELPRRAQVWFVPAASCVAPDNPVTPTASGTGAKPMDPLPI